MVIILIRIAVCSLIICFGCLGLRGKVGVSSGVEIAETAAQIFEISLTRFFFKYHHNSCFARDSDFGSQEIC